LLEEPGKASTIYKFSLGVGLFLLFRN
jgi:hypothetical protein